MTTFFEIAVYALRNRTNAIYFLNCLKTSETIPSERQATYGSFRKQKILELFKNELQMVETTLKEM